LIIDYIERYKNLFGVEPIAAALTSADVSIAPSTFYAARTRPPRRGLCATRNSSP
jgi:putative transposase